MNGLLSQSACWWMCAWGCLCMYVWVWIFVCAHVKCVCTCVWLKGGLAKIQSCFTMNGYPLFRQVTATSTLTHVHGSTVTLTTLTGCQAAAGLPQVAPVLPEIIHLATPLVSVAALFLVVAHWSLFSCLGCVGLVLVFFWSCLFCLSCFLCCGWLLLFLLLGFYYVFLLGGGVGGESRGWGVGGHCYHMLGLASVSCMGIFSQYSDQYHWSLCNHDRHVDGHILITRPSANRLGICW